MNLLKCLSDHQHKLQQVVLHQGGLANSEASIKILPLAQDPFS